MSLLIVFTLWLLNRSFLKSADSTLVFEDIEGTHGIEGICFVDTVLSSHSEESKCKPCLPRIPRKRLNIRRPSLQAQK